MQFFPFEKKKPFLYSYLNVGPALLLSFTCLPSKIDGLGIIFAGVYLASLPEQMCRITLPSCNVTVVREENLCYGGSVTATGRKYLIIFVSIASNIFGQKLSTAGPGHSHHHALIT